MKKYQLENDYVHLPSPSSHIKKITGTRFAAILGLKPWCTPFECWCEMTGVYKKPFEDNKYTLAGKTIEPKIIAWIDKTRHFGKGVCKSPEQWFGKTKEQLHYDHFPENNIFGGMWDCRTHDIVYEIKTTKKAEDWIRNDELEAPEYYKLQAALYTFLLGLDKFRLVVSFLDDPKDYDHPEHFVPSHSNTRVKTYSLKEEYPDFENKINYCMEWYEKYIQGGNSPKWDVKRDADILKALKTSTVAPTDTDVNTILTALEPIQLALDTQKQAVENLEKRCKVLKEQLKQALIKKMCPSDDHVEATGAFYRWLVISSSRSSIDTKAMKADGLLEKYQSVITAYTLKPTAIKEEQ